jgi:3-deoxy-D-manno-octulosonic-acid transferase
MPYLLNTVYLLALFAISPYLAYKSLTTGKYRRGLWRKLRGDAVPRQGDACCVWFHGVSVGEIHLLRPVVAQFRQRHPDWDCVVSSTTDTGYEEARRRFADLPVFYWPFDFSWAVQRALARVRPALVVLAEGELWPNFLLAARRRKVPVAVVNARMSPRSLSNYRRFRRVARPLFACLDAVAAQTRDYANNFAALGLPSGRIDVTGSVKFDGVNTDRRNPQTDALKRLLSITDPDQIWIAGSTQAPEEEIVLGLFRQLRTARPTLRLILVPRQRERFDEVAALLARSGLPFVRRSELKGPITDRNAVILVDTIGELGAIWGLADVAFVGGSLDGRRGGQNMIEPAAYGAAVVFGPHVWNFREVTAQLLQAGGAMQIANAAELQTVVERLLDDPAERSRLGQAARQFVQSQQGATERTLDCLDAILALRQVSQAA